MSTPPRKRGRPSNAERAERAAYEQAQAVLRAEAKAQAQAAQVALRIEHERLQVAPTTQASEGGYAGTRGGDPYTPAYNALKINDISSTVSSPPPSNVHASAHAQDGGVAGGVVGAVRLRKRFLESTVSDVQAQSDFRIAFSEDFGLWLRLTGWTYRVKQTDPVTGRELPSEKSHHPFVLWPCQERAAGEILGAVKDGRDVVIRKSRDMGASWLMAAVAVWGWMFHGWQGLLVSRVEDGVDKPSDPDSLFWKLDYILETQPPWLLPAPAERLVKRGTDCRQHMMLRNPVSGATITGQASTAHVGRGGRRTFVMFDEFAAMDDAESAWRSAADATACRIAVSTPLGAGTQYANLVRQARFKGDPRLVELLYTDHPEKGAGGEDREDVDGSVTGTVGAVYRWTPWLEQQRGRRDTMDMAQNVFATEVGSGQNFFTPRVVTDHMARHADMPRRCELVRGRMVDDVNGRWRVWRVGERDREYVMFADPAYGTGAANSAVAVMDAESRELVAEFADPNIPPHDLSNEMVEAAMTVYRGRRYPIIGWEVNGAGAAMHHDFERIGYSEVYRQRIIGTASENRTGKVGWHSTRRSKRTLLGGLNRSLAQGEVVVRSMEALTEMLEYVVMDDGAIEAASVRDLSSGARESHGDRVIALAGALMLCDEGIGPERPKNGFSPDSLGAILRHDEVFR